MSGNSLDSFLFQSFSNTIRQNIYILMKNFPKVEENQITLTKQILNYLISFDIVVDNFVNKCCIFSSVNLRSFFLDILEYFSQIPLDMSKTKYSYPQFFTEEMKEKSITSFPLRLCTYYVSHSILTKLIYHLVIRTDLLKNDHYPLIYSTINQILFHEINDKNSFNIDIINISKWSIVLHKMSKIIPDIIISDAFNHIQSSQLLHNNYHIFILRLYSFLYYPKDIFNNFPLISVTFQHLMSILNSNRASNQLLVAGNKFIRNFLGYTVQYQQTPDILSLFKEINRCLSKIQNDQCSCNSTLVLFNTLSNDKLSFFPLQKFFSLITRQFPTSQIKITDVIKTFIAILNGHFYMNFFNIERLDENFFKSVPNRRDKIYIQQMLDIVYSNMNQFKHCQKELGLFLSKVSSINFTWFIRKQLNHLIQNDFFQQNSEAVLFSAIIILSNETVILQNSKINSPNDSIVVQFKKSIINVCQKVMDDHPIDLFTTKCWMFETNDFTNSLSLNSLTYEIEQIIDRTSLIPLMCNNESEKDVASDIFFELARESDRYGEFLNNVDQNQLRFYQMNPIVHKPIEKVLTLCLLLAQEIELTSPNVFNRIPMYLFSDSPFVSALTIRIIQAFIHVKRDQSVLNSLLALQTFEYEQLYIYGLALIRTVKSLANCRIGLNVNSANSILAWQWILLSAPFSIIRELGLKLAEAVVPILPYENFPNVHKFVIKHDEEIFQRSVSMLSLTFSYKTFSIEKLKRFKFRDVMHSNSYLLYYTFFIHALKVFSINEDRCPKLNHTMNVTHAQAISLINSKKNNKTKDNCYFMLNLMALRLATSPTFDRFTSPEQILSLLRQGTHFLYMTNCDKRICFLFFFSVNPCLNLKFKFPDSLIHIYTFCFYFRLFIHEYFKEHDDTVNFTGIDYITINNYKNIYLTSQSNISYKDENSIEKTSNINFLEIDNSSSNSIYNDSNSAYDDSKKASKIGVYNSRDFIDVENYADYDAAEVNERGNDLITIEKVLRFIVYYFDKCSLISKSKLKEIDTVRMIICGDDVLIDSICHLLTGLVKLFEEIRKKFITQNKSFFLNKQTYTKEGHSFEEQPFDSNIWFPFLYNITLDRSNESKTMADLANKALSILISFNQVPDVYMAKIINDQELLNEIINRQICLPLLVSSPKILLPILCEKASTNRSFNQAIYECFREPRGIAKNLEEIKDDFSKCINFSNSFENDFDTSCLNEIGNLISLSFFNLSFETNECSFFKIIYNICLFAISSNLPQSNKLIQIINQIHNTYFDQNLLIPTFLVVKLSSVLAEVFKKFTEQFLNNFFELVTVNFNNSKNDMLTFIQFSIPWFSNVNLNHSMGIVPNNHHLTSQSFLTKLFSLRFIQNNVETTFSQLPLPSFSQSILDIIAKNSLKYVIDFVLRESSIIESKPMLIYLTVKYSKQLIPYLASHLRFEFTYYMEIQNDERKLCGDMICKITDVFVSLLYNQKELALPYLHILYVYCFVKRMVKPTNKKEIILNEICKIFKENDLIECLKHLITDNSKREETIHEVFFWMVSNDDLRDSLKAIQLFQYLTKSGIITKSDTSYISDINMNIKIICSLLNQNEGYIEIPSFYYEYISNLMIVLCSLESPPIDISIDLLRCNSMQFSPLFTTSLNIVLDNIEKCQKRSDEIFLSLITAELSQSIIELIFGSITKMIVGGIFTYENNIDVFLSIIPYFLVNFDKKVPNMNFLYEAFGNEKSEIIINAYKNAIESNEPVFTINNESFDKFILEMIDQISGEVQFHIFSFFMKVLTVDEYKYFHPIYMISLVLLRNQSPNPVLCYSVFSPLCKFFVSHQNDIKKINELIKFIQIFEENDSIIFPSNKRISNFPAVALGKKIELAFCESYPVVLYAFKFFESDLIDEIRSFIISIQFMKYIRREKEYNESKNLVVTGSDSTSTDFNFNINDRILRINTVLNLLKGKKTYIIPSNVSKIIKVNCSVFRTIDNIDELLK